VFAQLRVLLDGSVQVVDIGCMMLIMMQLHGFGIDVGFKSCIVIGKRW
jgi:hypothetical protein